MLSAQVSALFLNLVDAFLRTLSPLFSTTITGTLTSASASVTALGSATGIEIGAVVTGTGIPSSPPTTVIAIDNTAHTATLSANATASGAEMLTFTNPGVLSSFEMGLFTNVVNPTVSTVLTDLTQPAYPGYALQPMTVNPPKIDALGNRIQDYNSCHFQPTGTWVGGVPCLGYFVQATYAGMASLLYTENFASPVNLLVATDSTDVLFDGYVSNLLTWGGLCASC